MERLKLDIQLFASTSGNLTTGANEDGTTFYLNWQQTTQGIDSQGRPYTRINWQIGINARYEYYSNAVQMGATTINGVQVHGGGTWSYIDSGTHQLANGSTTIYHNSNGTKTFSASISGWTIGCNWVSGSKSWELTRIPTASKVDSVTFEADLQGRTNNIEKPFTITFTRYDSSFTDNLKIQYSSNPQDSSTWVTFKTIENIESGTTLSFTQSELNVIYNVMSSRVTAPLQFILETYSGETLIGTSEPLGRIGGIYDANPTFSGVTFEDTNSTTTALTGNNQIIIKGYSNATLTIPVATGNKGATIVDYVIDGVDEPIPHTGSPLTYTINSCTFGTFNVYARDSRGNTKLSTVIASSTKSYEKIYLDISNSKIERWENGSESATGNEAKLTLRGTIWNNNFGSEDNAITSSEYRLKITDSSGDPVLGTTDITPTINQDGTITFSDKIRSDNPDYSWNIGDSYYVYITVADRLSSSSIVLTLNSAIPTISLSKNGLGVMCDFDDSLGGYLQVNGQKVDPNASGIPNGSEFDYNGNTVPDGYEEVTTYDDLKAYTLYDNPSGSNGTIQLSDSASNYAYIEIFAKCRNHATDCVYTKVVGSSSNASLHFFDRESSSVIRFWYSILTLSGNTISCNTHWYQYIQGGNKGESNNSYFYIIKVVGYKEV